MSSILSFLSLFLFSAEIRDLGSAEYAVRAKAHRRLQEAGILAWLPLRIEQQKLRVDREATGPLPTPPSTALGQYSITERQYRVEILLDRMPVAREWFAQKLLNLDLQLPLKPSVENALTLYGPWLSAYIDEHHDWWTTAKAWQWVVTKPYLTGSEFGDLIHCLSTVKERRRNLTSDTYTLELR